MGSSPTVSSDNKTFTVTPSLKMYYSKTYKIRVTTAAKDSAGNHASQYTHTDGFTTTFTIPITTGSAHSCFMLDNGSVKCWGKNNMGQLGLGDTSNRGDNSSEMGDNLTTIDLGTGRTATAIEAGNHHTCAILDNASIKCWGSNASGQLGLGDTSNRGDGSILVKWATTSLQLTWAPEEKLRPSQPGILTLVPSSTTHPSSAGGQMHSGQLGLGDTDNRGDGSNEMGDNLTTVDLGTGRTAKAITAGDSILVHCSTTHPSSAGEKIVMVSWAKGIRILTTVETNQTKWGTTSRPLTWVPEEPPHPLLLVLNTRVLC